MRRAPCNVQRQKDFSEVLLPERNWSSTCDPACRAEGICPTPVEDDLGRRSNEGSFRNDCGVGDLGCGAREHTGSDSSEWKSVSADNSEPLHILKPSLPTARRLAGHGSANWRRHKRL